MANYTLKYTGEEVDQLLEKIDTSFGEKTVMGDTLTWDGDMTGREKVAVPVADGIEGYFVHISDIVPTYEELQAGGSCVTAGQLKPFTAEEVADLEGILAVGESIVIVKEDNTDLTDMIGVIVPKKGIYVMSIPALGVLIDSFTINNYTGFETTEIKTIDSKFIGVARTYFYPRASKLYIDQDCTILATTVDIKNAYDVGQIIVSDSTWEYFVSQINFLTYPHQVVLVCGNTTYTIGSAD